MKLIPALTIYKKVDLDPPGIKIALEQAIRQSKLFSFSSEYYPTLINSS